VVAGYLYDEAGKEQAYMFHHDPVTSVVALTGHTGSLEEASHYHPFGAARAGGALRFVLAGGARIPSVAVFPELHDVPIAADWDGDGKSEVRVVGTAPNQSGYRFPLGPDPSHVDFGVLAAHDPVVGDWDGNGSLNAGVTTRNGTGGCPSCLVWFLDLHSGGVGEIEFTFGETGDTPIVGDWDGNGSTNVGFVRASGGTLAFHLNVDNQGTPWSVVAFGLAGDAPVVGDWDGDGATNVGVLREQAGVPTFLLDTNGGGEPELVVPLPGAPMGAPVAGDWSGIGMDTVGVRVATATGNTLRYTGRERDPDTGLYYYRARYYDPDIGRFLSEDPLGFGAGVNFYTYVGNNPLIANDPMGLKVLTWGVHADAVVGVGGTASAGAFLGWQETGRHAGKFDFGWYYEVGYATGADVGFGAEFGIDADTHGPNRAASLPNPLDAVPYADIVTLQVEFSSTDGGIKAVQGSSIVVGPSVGIGSIQTAYEFDYSVRDAIEFFGGIFSSREAGSTGHAAGPESAVYPSEPRGEISVQPYWKP
jgi:RHS repeat-associated protein